MATVNSLVCFGGLNGKTVTFTDAGDVVNLTNHGVRPGLACFLQNSGGALPIGLSANTLYYTKQGADQNKFLLYPTQADAIAGTNQVTFSGTGSGTTVVKSALVFTGADLSRYNNARIYDGLVSWNTGRSGASAYDIEVCEIGESFSDIITSAFVVTVPSAQNIIISKVNGIRSAAFHAGVYPAVTLDTLTLSAGYVFYNSSVVSGSLFKITRYRDTIDGLILMNKANASVTVADLDVQCRLYSCLVIGAASSVVGTGLNLRSALGEAVNNLFIGFTTGSAFGSSQLGLYYVNNTVTKCTAAFSAAATVKGFFYNNISVGNTTNWPTQPTALEGASNNAGLSGEAWMTTGGSRITIATTDFNNYANNNFRAASSSSPQVEAGIAPYGAPLADIADHVRPDYMNGGAAAYDLGCYEFDHGYGPWPATHTLTLTNVVVGSRVFVRDQADTTTHYDQIAASSTVVVAVTVYGDARDNWKIKIRKASAAPYYQAYETLMTATAGSSSIYVNQLPN